MKYKKDFILRLSIFIFSIFLPLLTKANTLPLAKKGVLDLRSVDMENIYTIPLAGEWEFYYGEHLDKDANFKEKDLIYINAYKQLWGQVKHKNKSLTPYGKGTYRLKVLLPEGYNLPLNIEAFLLSSLRFYINNKLLLESPNFASSIEDYGNMYMHQGINEFTPTSNVLNILVHCTSINGLPLKAKLIPKKTLKHYFYSVPRFADFIALGVLFFMFCYHLFLYYQYRRDITPLYFSIMTLGFVGTQLSMMSMGTIFNQHLLISFLTKNTIVYSSILCGTIAVVFLTEFIRTTVSDYSRNLYFKILYGMMGFFITLAGLFTGTIWQRTFNSISVLLTVVAIITTALLLGRGYLKKNSDAKIIVYGSYPFFFSIIIFILDLYANLVHVSFSMASIGNLFFMSSQAMVVSRRFSRAFNDLELRENEINQLNKILQKRVEEKTASLRSMLDGLSQIIFTIDAKGNIANDRSNNFSKIFSEYVNNVFIILEKSNLSSDKISQTKSACLTIGEEVFSFKINQHIFPKRLEMDNKIYEVDWNPVLDQDNVTMAILISMKDITVLEKIKKKSENQRAEISRLLELLDNPVESIKRNLDLLKSLVKDVVKATQTKDTNLYIKVLRNIHTIKGNSRMLNLSEIAQKCHEVEDSIKILDDKESVNLNKFMTEISGTIENYENVYEDKLSVMKGSDNITLPKQVALESLEMLKTRKDPLNKLFEILDGQLRNTLKTVLSPISKSLDRIANRLEKPIPTLEINDNNLTFPERLNNFVVNISNHIIRNSLDHGIEFPKERIKMGKPEAGKIKVDFTKDKTGLTLSFYDDGKGLDLGKIEEKIKEKGLDIDTSKTENIIDAIFLSEFTTRDFSTELSGRGIGMDAIKEYVEIEEGEFSIVKLEGNNPNPKFYPFVLVVKVPYESQEEAA